MILPFWWCDPCSRANGVANAMQTRPRRSETECRADVVTFLYLRCHLRSEIGEPKLRVLELSRCARDLRLSDEDLVLNIGSNWDAHEIFHCCALDSPLDYRARTTETHAAYAMPFAKRTLTLTVGARMTKALKYRWKGFEEAVGVVIRKMRTHDVVQDCTKRTYPITLVDKAQRTLAELCGRAGGGVDLDCRLARTLERHVVVKNCLCDWSGTLREPPSSVRYFCVARFCASRQSSWSLDTDMLSYRRHQCTQLHKLLVDTGAWRAEAMAANWWVLSGSAGRKIIREYSNMIAEFKDAGWSGLKLTASDKWHVCPTLLVATREPCVDVFKTAADDDSIEG